MTFFYRPRHHHLRIALEVDDLPPLACFGEQFVGGRTEALARVRHQQQALLRLVDDQRHDMRAGIDIQRIAHRFAKAARAGQLVRADREEPPLVGRQQQLVGSLRMDHEGRTIAFLVFEILIQRQMSLCTADPALLRQDHRYRLLLDHRVHAEFDRGRRFPNAGAAGPQCRVFAIFLAQRIEIALQARALACWRAKQLFQFVLFLEQIVLFLAKLHFLKLAQTAQPHVQDRFGLPVGQAEFLHHHRLGLILVTDDLDHPVEVEEGDDVAFDQLQPPRDLVQPVLAAALQNVDLAGDPVIQQFLQPHHHRRAAGVEHVEVEPEPRFHIGQLVQAFLEQLGVDIAAARDQHDADLFIALVAHVFQDRQLPVGDCLRDLFDQLALGHLIGDLADHELPLPATHPLDPRFAILRAGCFCRVKTPAHTE